MCMTEEWKNISCIEGLEDFTKYEISSYGRVKSYKRLSNGCIIKSGLDKNGYKLVVLFSDNCVCKTFRLARLVAKIFISNPNNLPQVNHINGIKDDDRVENLEWVTNFQNIDHRYKILGQKPPRTDKLIEKEVKEIWNLLHTTNLTQKEIAYNYCVNDRSIANISTGRTWNNITNKIYRKKEKKLSENEILEIYNLCWNTNKTQEEIAGIYNITSHYVSRIKCGIRCNHITKHIK
jgi:hypothetical protein